MNDVVVTQYWMFGVMGVMAAFGIAAIIGWLKGSKKA